MTIVAYRNGILAADSAIYAGSVYAGIMLKLARSPYGTIAGAAGRTGICVRFRKWIEGGLSGDFDPKSDESDFGAILAEPDAPVMRMQNDGVMVQIDGPFHAEGTGEGLALGAMAAGASAEEAVRIAIEYDAYCGGPISILRLGE